MATTIVQAKHKVVNTDGSIVLYHYQTNADIVVNGTTKKVPLITDIAKWDATTSEVNTARDGLGSLDARLDRFDVSLLAANLLIEIKKVDGPLSDLNADHVDGCGVNDAAAGSLSVLWTSYKIQTALDLKVDDNEVSATAAANKILRLNANGKLPADITGNSGTTTKFAGFRAITFGGDVTGDIASDFSGDITIDLVVKDNSHSHSGLILSGSTTAENTSLTGNVMDFKQAGVIKSSIGSNGDFSGKSASSTKLSTSRKITFGGNLSGDFNFDGTTDVTASVIVVDAKAIQGKTVDDTKLTNAHLWTAEKIVSMLGSKMDSIKLASLKATQGRLIADGIIIQWGVVDMANKTTAIATFSMPFNVAPYQIISSDETADFTWFFKRKPASTTVAQTEFICNKSIANAKISWIAIGA